MKPRTALGAKLISDKDYKLVFFALISFGINSIFALYNLFLGISSGSLWFIAMTAYYIILGVMRFFAATASEAKSKAVALTDGLLLIVLSILLGAIIYISLYESNATEYGTIPMITIATYTFYKITISVIRAVKARGARKPIMSAIRCIGYAEVAVSLLTMQQSMLVSFEGMNESGILLMNAMTGGAVCLFIIWLGISLIGGEKIWQNRK